jgi:hypothetical protein
LLAVAAVVTMALVAVAEEAVVDIFLLLAISLLDLHIP